MNSAVDFGGQQMNSQQLRYNSISDGEFGMTEQFKDLTQRYQDPTQQYQTSPWDYETSAHQYRRSPQQFQNAAGQLDHTEQRCDSGQPERTEQYPGFETWMDSRLRYRETDRQYDGTQHDQSYQKDYEYSEEQDKSSYEHGQRSELPFQGSKHPDSPELYPRSEQYNNGSQEPYRGGRSPQDQFRDRDSRRYSPKTTQIYRTSEEDERYRFKEEPKNSERNSFIVSLHGLPFSTSHADITEFLDGCAIIGGREGIHIVHGEDGRPTGDAFVELASQVDMKEALQRNRKHIGKRYIEVFQVNQQEMEFVMSRSSVDDHDDGKGDDCVVRLRGLPYGCTKEEVENFFLDLPIAPNGITILTDPLGRTEGSGYVQFVSPDFVPEALQKDRDKIRHRYIEVYKSNPLEVKRRLRKPSPWSGGRRSPYDHRSWSDRPYRYEEPDPYDRHDPYERRSSYERPGPYDRHGPYDRPGPYDRHRPYERPSPYDRSGPFDQRGRFNDRFDRRDFRGNIKGEFRDRGIGRRFGGGGGGGGDGTMDREQYHSQTGHFVHMRGLPYSATKTDIEKFFYPLNPVGIYFEYNQNGKVTGNANVDFASHDDAEKAMSKHRDLMQHRYIELFLNKLGGRFGRY